MAHRVGHHHALHRVEGEIAVEVPELQHRDHEQRGLRERVGDDAVLARHPEVDQGHHAGEDQQQDQGDDGVPVHGPTLLTATWRSRLSTEAWVMSVSGLRVDADHEHQRGQAGQHGELTLVEVLQAGDVGVGHRTEVDPLDHPQRVRSAPDQGRGGEQADPEVELHRAEDDHPFADEARSARQAAIGHREQHGQGHELRHGVDDAAVGRDLARVDTVVEHADAEEHGARDEAVRDHLHDGAFGAEAVEHEEAQRHEAHVGNRRVGDQLFHVSSAPGRPGRRRSPPPARAPPSARPIGGWRRAQSAARSAGSRRRRA